MSGKQTPFPLLRLGLKLSFLIKLIVRGGSGEFETSYSYAAICLNCSNDFPWCTFPHFALFFSPCTYDIIVIIVINSCFSFSAGISGLVLWCLLSPLSYPLKPHLVEARITDSARGFFLLKGFFFFRRLLVHVHDGGLNWREGSMQSIRFLSLATFFNWLCINWTYLELNQFDLIMIVLKRL